MQPPRQNEVQPAAADIEQAANTANTVDTAPEAPAVAETALTFAESALAPAYEEAVGAGAGAGASASVGVVADLSARLAELKGAHNQGLITAKEHQAARASVLAAIGGGAPQGEGEGGGAPAPRDAPPSYSSLAESSYV